MICINGHYERVFCFSYFVLGSAYFHYVNKKAPNIIYIAAYIDNKGMVYIYSDISYNNLKRFESA